jgi:hypothetical protein
VLVEDLGDLSSYPARVRRDVGPAVSQSDDAEGGGGIVAVYVSPPGLRWVRGSPVELDNDVELHVVVVEIPGSLADSAAGLANRTRQSMCSLHVVHVSPLQAGMDAFANQGECPG